MKRYLTGFRMGDWDPLAPNYCLNFCFVNLKLPLKDTYCRSIRSWEQAPLPSWTPEPCFRRTSLFGLGCQNNLRTSKQIKGHLSDLLINGILK
jgi:hypothetical protein